MIALSGGRRSCDMLARNSLLLRFAASTSRTSPPISALIRFGSSASAPSSSRFGTSTRFAKSPAAISPKRASICLIGPISDYDIA